VRFLGLLALFACNDNTVASNDLAVAADLATMTRHDASGAACGLTAQDCASDEKCTWTEDNIHLQVPSCVSLAGQKAEGEPCTATTLGNDDCGRGLLCTNLGAIASDFRCLRVCTGTIAVPVRGECNSDELCATLNPAYGPGVCIKPCDAFASDCPSSLRCGRSAEVTPLNFVYFPMCVAQVSCSNMPCGLGRVCANVYGFTECVPICDGAHGCEAADGGVAQCGSVFGACNYCWPSGNHCAVSQYCCSGNCNVAGVCE
jgi:hypothetical protein